MISLPPVFSMKVSWPHSAGTIASSAPASMKLAPEAALDLAHGFGFFAGDDPGSS
jgi:hypothetical protein